MKAFFTILILISCLFAYTQEMFSTDPERFHRDFGSSLRFTGEVREDAASMRREFSNFWTSDTLSFEEKENFMRTANIMGSRGAKDFPDFVCFAANIMTFKRLGIDWEQYENYEKALIDMLTKPRRPNLREFSDYMISINRLTSRNIVQKNPRTYWKAYNNDFFISYDGNTIKVNFYNVNLIGYQNADSLKIEQTSGEYFPDRNRWVGNGGIVTWERVGYSRDSIIAELSHYEIDMRQVSYTADSVNFVNSIFFRTPMQGRLIDKTRNISDPSRSDYPKFISYQQHFEIENLVNGLNYEGGFSIHGRRFIGSGTAENPATINIRKNDTISFTAYSQRFIIEPEFILSDNTAITLRLSKDSIYHPNLNFKYHNRLGFLELIRTKEDMSKVNYVNSYHNLNMDFSHFKWFIDKFKIEFTMIGIPGVPNESLFESSDFYRRERYRSIQKRDPRHPVEVVTSFASQFGSKEYTLSELSQFMGYSVHQVIRMVLDLAYRNFLFFDPETEIIRVYPEATRFLEAHRGVRDSDVMQFHSQTPSHIPNAELSLLNFNLQINGIPEVHLSDSQNVRVFPIDNKIVLRKNRDFAFNGTIQAGQFYFYGSNFDFNYNEFKIDIAHCDSMKMVAETPYLDTRGEAQLAIVRNKLEGFSGEFFIDDPMNKSGRKTYPEYPKFNTRSTAYVYFDRHDIYGGVYDRNRFYFEIDPFEKDSIDGFSVENIRFAGTLVSGGIFPDIKQDLVLRRHDFSLGFRTRTGPVGLPLYDSKATYWHEIDLSNYGLTGKGRIAYLTAQFDAEHLVFFLDSLNGRSEKMLIAEQDAPIQYPAVSGTDNTLNWNVHQDQFNIRQRSEEFQMFKDQSTLEGNLMLSTGGLFGEGIVNFPRARLISDEFKFQKETIESDTADFDLYTETVLNIDFRSDNVNAFVSYETRKGIFKSNGEKTLFRFPRNQYISEMSQLTWYMDHDELEMSADTDVLAKLDNIDSDSDPRTWEELFLEGPTFTSVHPDQDSLKFVAPRARYNYNDHIIYAEGVEFIRVADANIYPQDRKITVERNAVMRPIPKANIIANTTTRYHYIYDATVNIFGRRNYSGYGDYDYVDATGGTQKVHFNTISVDVTAQTYANADVVEPDNFMISPHYHFLGTLNLFANDPNLKFDGGVRIIHECENLQDNWVKFSAVIDPEDIYIPIQRHQYDLNDNRLSTGLLLTRTREVYPSFLSRLTSQFDEEIFTVTGYLHYDLNDGNFKIGDKDKIVETSLPGDYIEIHRFICNVSGEGTMNFSNDFGRFKPNAIGSFRYNPANDTVEFSLAMLMEAHFNDNAKKMMADKINATSGLVGLDLRHKTYEKAILEYLEMEKAEEWFSNLSLGNFRRMPSELSNKFIFADLNFKWYGSQNSFIHHGPIGIATVGSNQVNRYVFGFIRIAKSRRGDIFEMLIEPDSDTWYYFRYSAGNFSGISSDEEFNLEVYETRPRQRELTSGEGPPYVYGLGSSANMRRFKRDMYRQFNIPDDDQ